MAYFLFIDESGQDHHESPYEVLAGVSMLDKDLWTFIKAAHSLELDCFGRKYRANENEIKATKFLKRKTFRLAAQLPPIPTRERTALAKEGLDNKIFASIIYDPTMIPKDKKMLRKDYVYLFERFYYFLEDKSGEQRGIVVFDELDKSASHLLLDQMDGYFKKTSKGRYRAGLIIPEPFFVHSDLTTGIQIVDFVAYILSWSFRAGKLNKPCREELSRYLELLMPLRYKTTRHIEGARDYTIWSLSIV